MKKYILSLILLFCFSGCSDSRLSPSKPKTNEWFSDKEIVSFNYKRDSWEKSSSFYRLNKTFSDGSFRITCSENGGMTKNSIELRFRVTPSNIKKYHQLHKILISKDFYESLYSPETLVSKLPAAERALLKEKLEKKIKIIENKIPLILSRLFETNVDYTVELSIHDLKSSMLRRRELSNIPLSTEIILPKVGCSVYSYTKLRNDKINVLNYILDELSEFK